MSNINVEELKKDLQERNEAVRTQFLSELEAKRNEVNKQIEQKEGSIANVESEIREQLEGYEKHRSLSRGEKVLDAKVYKVINSVAKSYLAQVRERRRTVKALENEKAELQAELEGINEENLKDELIKRQETVKEQFILELKDKQEELKKQIEEKQSEIKKQQNKYVEAVKSQSAYESISGIKHLEAKTYKAAQEKACTYLMKARKINNKMKKLEHQVAEAQEDFENLDSYIQELAFGRNEDIVEQEDEMWKAYREEQEKNKEQQENEMWKEHDAQVVKEQEDEMWEEYRSENNKANNRRKIEETLAWKQHDRKEKDEMDQIEKQTEEEIKIYNDEEDKKEQEKPNKPEKQEENEKGLDEKDFNDILNIFEKRDRKQQETNKQESNQEEWEKIFAIFDEKEQQPTQELTPEKFKEIQEIFSRETPQTTKKVTPQPEKKYSVNKIKFYFKNGKPVYEVALNSSDKDQEYVRIKGWSNIEKLQKEKSDELSKSIENPDRFFDPNIEGILRTVDIQCDTGALDKYMQLMQAYKVEDIEKIDLKVEYDFSNLDRKPSSLENKLKLAYIKKLAKANSKLERASYEKEPNFLKRMWNRIKTLKLAPAYSTQENYINEVIEQDGLANEQNPVSKEEIMEALKSGIEYQEFDAEEFAKSYGISQEEVNTYMEEIKNEEKNSSRKWKAEYIVPKEKLNQTSENATQQRTSQDREI